MKRNLSLKPLVAALALIGTTLAFADINIGVNVSATGPGAVLGGPQKNTTQLFPTSFAGEKINWIVLDDASDPTATAKNVSKLITENKVDILFSGTTTPGVMATVGPATDSKTPLIALAPNRLEGERFKWTFTMPQPISLMAEPLLEHAKAKGYKTMAFLGYYPDAYGEVWKNAMEANAAKYGITFGPIEGFARTDTSVTGQVLKVQAAKPDAVLIAGSGTPAALPQKALRERGYTGKIYQTHGVANNDFLRVGGKDVEGTILPAGPMLVAAQLPADHPVRKSALAYVNAYEAKYGKGSVSTFGGHGWDAGLLVERAATAALKKAQPGTPAFRAAMRDALEAVKEMPGAHGIFNMSAGDHNGLDQRGRVMVTISGGTWKYIGD